jgi:dipeptidase D
MSIANIAIVFFLSGHSGIEIHTGRANANKCLARILNVTRQKVDFRIVSLNGGGAPNVIPRESFAKVRKGRDENQR